VHQFLAPVLGRDDVEVLLRSGTSQELLQAVESMNLDVVLANLPPAPDAGSTFVSHRLEQQQVSLVGVAALLVGDNELAGLLARLPVILPTTTSGLRVDCDALANRLDVTPQIAAEVDDMAMMRLLTREGIGLGVLPPIVVQDELESGRLVEAHQLPGIVETFFAVTLARRFPNPLLPELLPTC
jgi:LysR family transcriptional activator of nhaA